MSKHTPLYDAHVQLNAKLVDFHGWMMPLNYGSQIQEHEAVRDKAGLFDVSHMTIVDLLGTGTRQFLRKLLTNDIDRLNNPGRALYTCMCNEQGGIIDDLIVYYRGPENYRLILNSATRENDLRWIREKAQGFATDLQERPELGIIALQGKDAIALACKTLSANDADAISTLKRFDCVDVDTSFFARTGYTGEDGLEMVLPHEKLVSTWKALIDAGVTPCGLAARDTLRLEAGLMLYGQDMDETTTPLESALGWTIAWEPEARDFIGMGALLSQKNRKPERKLVGLTLQDKGIMRTGQRVIMPGYPDGIITSGVYSPTCKQSIALARIPTAYTETSVDVEIRGKAHKALIGKPRFLVQS